MLLPAKQLNTLNLMGLLSTYLSKYFPSKLSEETPRDVPAVAKEQAPVLHVQHSAGRIECCDVKFVAGEDTVDVKLRACMKGEMLA
ncbi:hypothetical protein WN944_026625 [Citrus x changshan-huyou]|uniref:Uncharacterized protein n=1 Tax=Citrus x changshan-huyou TaxID=2935761 RepID=A0AAP0LRY7_9ROSI